MKETIIVTKAKEYEGYFAVVKDPTKGFKLKHEGSPFADYTNQLHITEDTKALAEQRIFEMLLKGNLHVVDDPVL